MGLGSWIAFLEETMTRTVKEEIAQVRRSFQEEPEGCRLVTRHGWKALKSPLYQPITGEELWVMENEPTVLIELSEAGKKFYKSKKT